MTITTDLSTVSTITADSTPAEILMANYLSQHAQYEEFAQSRTNFQIEKFIAEADNTPVNCYVNTLHQTRVMNGELLREVKEATELMRTFQIKWFSDGADRSQPIKWPDHNGVDRHCWYDMDKIAHDHRVMELSINIKDKLQQLNTFYKILEQLRINHGRDFTRQDYENEAPEYWNARFQKQVLGDIVNAKFGINSGNLEGIIHGMAAPILPDSVNTGIDFPIREVMSLLANGQVYDVLNFLQVNTTNKICAINNTTPEQSAISEAPSFEQLGVVKN